MSFSIEGKTAIVTGGANGVGCAIGRHFADQGRHARLLLRARARARASEEFGRTEKSSYINRAFPIFVLYVF